MPGYTIEVDGLSEVEAMFLRLSEFREALRKPLNAALGEAKRVMQAQVGSRQAKAAIKVYTWKTDDGIKSSAGPKSGKTRKGWLAAHFLETGTGLFTKHPHRATPRGGGVMVIPAMAETGIRPSAEMFTAKGAVRASALKKGTVGIFVRSTVGMRPRPWYDRSIRQAEPLVKTTFRTKLNEELHGNG